jgi:hypothetical protein
MNDLLKNNETIKKCEAMLYLFAGDSYIVPQDVLDETDKKTDVKILEIAKQLMNEQFFALVNISEETIESLNNYFKVRYGYLKRTNEYFFEFRESMYVFPWIIDVRRYNENKEGDNMVDINKIREALAKAKEQKEMIDNSLLHAEDAVLKIRERLSFAENKVAAYQDLLDDALKTDNKKIKDMMRCLDERYKYLCVPNDLWYQEELKKIQEQCTHVWEETTGDYGPITYKCELCNAKADTKTVELIIE